MRIKVSNYIARKLVESGTVYGFSVVGGGVMHLNNALGHEDGLTIIYDHHEQACTIAAECYARISNKLAVVCVTTGSGGTNALTGVVGTWLDSIPMLVPSGQIRTDWAVCMSGVYIRALGGQEFDIRKPVAAMTKYCGMVTDPLCIRYCPKKTLYLTESGRPGPTWFDIPLDVQGVFVETDELPGFDPGNYEAGGDGFATSLVHKIPEDEVGKGEYRAVLPKKVIWELAEEIIDCIVASKRSVFNAGNGIRIANAYAESFTVARKLGIPVVVGRDSKDCLPSDDPLYVGRLGNSGDRPGNFVVQNADLVFSVGSRLSVCQVGSQSKAQAHEALMIVNGIDAEELEKPTIHISLSVHVDAKDLLTVMSKLLDERQTSIFGGGEGLRGMSWSETCKYWVKRYPAVQEKYLVVPASYPANVYALTRKLGDAAKENVITAVGDGSACVVGGHAYRIKKGQRFVSNSTIASMGYDLSAVIGVAKVNEDCERYERGIVLLTGDGSIMTNPQELQTISGAKMPTRTFPINNDGYYSTRQTERNLFGDQKLVGIGSDSGDLSFPSFEKIAVVFELPYVAARSSDETDAALQKTLAAEGPILYEVFVDTDQNFEPKSGGKRLPDGMMVSPPLEELTPFLSEEEPDENMTVSRYRP